jgi:hypothetical protein
MKRMQLPLLCAAYGRELDKEFDPKKGRYKSTIFKNQLKKGTEKYKLLN